MVETLERLELADPESSTRFFLDDSEAMWTVATGYVDVFGVLASGLRHHVLRVESGESFFGVRTNSVVLRLFASAAPDSVVHRAPVTLVESTSLRSAWYCRLAGSPDAPDGPTALALLIEQIKEKEKASGKRLHARVQSEASGWDSALSNLASSVAGGVSSAFKGGSRGNLWAACEAVAKCIGVSVAGLSPDGISANHGEAVQAIALSIGLRSRTVTLNAQWRKRDAGPLLAFFNGNPVALIPGRNGYKLFDPASGRTIRLTATISAALDPCAYSFFRPLSDEPTTPLRLLWFGFRQCPADLVRLVLMALAAGLLALAAPIITAQFVGSVIPAADRTEAALLTLLLSLCSLCGALFSYASAIALQRTGGRAGAAILYALWERLLALPSSFFTQYSSSDLALRLTSIDQVRQTVTGPLITNTLGCPFAVLQILLLFHYSPAMALPAVLLAGGFVLFSAVSGVLLVRRSRTTLNHEAALASRVFEFLTGIAKIRVAGAESHAFASWAAIFGRHRSSSVKGRHISAAMSAMQAAAPLSGWALVVFCQDVARGTQATNVGNLLGFSMALQQVLASAVQFSSLLSGLAQVTPFIERVRPVLDTAPESPQGKTNPCIFSGSIEVQNVTFQYQPDRPVLSRVSFRVEHGEFVALVGASGSGKSTLLRLLLGFERPTSGAILYDNHDLRALNLHAVRRQMGVVLQDGQILDGDIGSNILGPSTRGLDAAWEAARLAGLESDIRSMPMQMHTRLSNGDGGLSGGQRQRLLIARALVNKPRILLFDEATSALDNRTQAVVSASLESLNATRIVIAHRLSTVRNADRILVLDSGVIAESGTYGELMARRGKFYEMARRQTLSQDAALQELA